MQDDNRAQHIWESFRSGDEAAFDRLFHLYSDALFYYGASITADRELVKDSIQELFCSLWERKGQCPEVKKVKSFLLSALRRILLRKIEQNKRFIAAQPGQENLNDRRPSGKTASFEETLIQKETELLAQSQLRKAVQSLSPRQREAIHLRYFQGLSYAEMAEVMAVQKNSVGQFIAQAVKALRKKMNRTNIAFSLLLLYLLVDILILNSTLLSFHFFLFSNFF